MKQRLKLAYEYESPARCNLLLEIVHVLQCGILVVKDAALVVYEHIETEIFVGKNDDRVSGVLVLYLYL